MEFCTLGTLKRFWNFYRNPKGVLLSTTNSDEINNSHLTSGVNFKHKHMVYLHSEYSVYSQFTIDISLKSQFIRTSFTIKGGGSG